MSRARRALITGVSGQDGTLLAELLRGRGVEVIGACRGPATARVAAAAQVVRMDLLDEAALARLVRDVAPDECYHLAAYHRSSQTLTNLSEAAEERLYLRTNLIATHSLLRAIVEHQPRCRVFLAGSCHMFGNAVESPQSEQTPFEPNTPYGITKVAAAQLGRMFRERFGLYCCTGILYNHESALRGPSFASARVARGAVEVLRGARQELLVGNLDAEVDWGFAGDYVEAMWSMLQAPVAEDFIIASGELHRVRDFVRLAFERVGLEWTKYVRQDPSVYKPVSGTAYFGDIRKIRMTLGWMPKTSFTDLVAMMVDHFLSAA